MAMLYDPDSLQRDRGEEVHGAQASALRAISLIKSITEKRRIAGRNPYLICVISRDSGEHRWQNLSPTYAGSVSNAENLLRGTWRVASFLEEDACKSHDENARVAELELRNQIRISELMSAGRGIMSAVHSADAERVKQKNGELKK